MRADDGLFTVDPVPPVSGLKTAVDKRYRMFDPHQVYLMPPSLDEWLPEGHLEIFQHAGTTGLATTRA
jgi:hypothetical protein